MSKTRKIDSHSIEFSNLDKVFYPKKNLTKGDIIGYYERIGKIMLEHLKDRPLVMHRFPDGIKGDNFYQKERPDYFPGWVGRTTVKLVQEGTQTLVVANNMSSLLYLADQGVLVFHSWLSRRNRASHPDRLVFDLDPPKKGKEGFSIVKFAAYKLKDILREKNLHPFVMSTGSHGLHIVAPINPGHNFDKVREFAKKVAQDLSGKNPDKLTVEARKNKRRGRLFIDYMRNAYGQTSVVPYSLRALPEAPVAAPLDWDELPSFSDPQKYTIKNIFRRLARKKNPWNNFFKTAKELKI